MNSSYKISLLYFHFDEKSSVRLAETIRQVAHQTTRRLIVVLVSPEFDHSQHEHLASKWDWIQNILVLAYVPAAHTAQIRDDPLFNTDVILVLDANQAARHLSGETWDAIFTLEGVPAPRLDDALLTKKANKRYIQSISERTASVRSFVRMFKPSIECDAVPIQDVYGPTGWDPNIQALVVSRETLVAQLRSEKSLPPLDLFVIDVISSGSVLLPEQDTAVLRESKLSSTSIREWLAHREEFRKK
ncbi:cytidylyltransferase domain-containing protein [Rhizoctonia solani]|uniref:Cytidylyltransferase domain-containing protein n=1 Tax=Rhizoctonia solani TaxID=456999 RepID=A0A8H8T4S3_9AGAM|nr:cytidylyltransferase domain-containing protein [Rhizoctonia solani]QRW27688.1 cytidylyltransferase domain-containing protein [Rhizoctonia solani]